jgi:hypothetical protein
MKYKFLGQSLAHSKTTAPESILGTNVPSPTSMRRRYSNEDRNQMEQHENMLSDLFSLICRFPLSEINVYNCS